jgi:hypothetical protein
MPTITPAAPPSAEASANEMLKTRLTLTPMAKAASWSWAVARMARPILVPFKSNCSASTSAPASPRITS